MLLQRFTFTSVGIAGGNM